MADPARIRISRKATGWTVQVRPRPFGIHDRWFDTAAEAHASAERLAKRLGIPWKAQA